MKKLISFILTFTIMFTSFSQLVCFAEDKNVTSNNLVQLCENKTSNQEPAKKKKFALYLASTAVVSTCVYFLKNHLLSDNYNLTAVSLWWKSIFNSCNSQFNNLKNSIVTYFTKPKNLDLVDQKESLGQKDNSDVKKTANKIEEQPLALGYEASESLASDDNSSNHIVGTDTLKFQDSHSEYNEQCSTDFFQTNYTWINETLFNELVEKNVKAARNRITTVSIISCAAFFFFGLYNYICKIRSIISMSNTMSEENLKAKQIEEELTKNINSERVLFINQKNELNKVIIELSEEKQSLLANNQELNKKIQDLLANNQKLSEENQDLLANNQELSEENLDLKARLDGIFEEAENMFYAS